MRSPLPDYLTEVLDACTDGSGTLADYIPELANVDPDRFALSLVTAEGTTYSAGDDNHVFTIQSISKPFVYGLALEKRGFEAVLGKIDVEPSGEAFNEISLERDSGRPLNPMINAGALTAHALVADADSPGTAIEEIRALLSALAGRELDIDEKVAASEMQTTYRNVAIANLLRGYEIFCDDPDEVVAGYVRQCSVDVTTTDLAMMAGTLASGGIQPRTGVQIFSRPVVRQVLSVMATCGMYDAAGDWLSTIGIPAKSGVSGGLIGVLPGQLGIAAYSPRLDEHGTSVQGVAAFERLSRDMNLHLMDAPMVAHSALRRRQVYGEGSDAVTLLELEGDIQFTNTEQIVHAVVDEPVTTPHVAIDLTLVRTVLPVGRRMLLELMRRLHVDGIDVVLIDPDGDLPDPDAGNGYRPRVVRCLEEPRESR
ncbi:glutaminase [Rhodococcus chondri]|uniref:Glutaminase n=1 Tax=Rhodococcus chondri TaxID=3065941 RepID=A0ABU7JPP5_9NOCA|nr:glutaminase [Rhodococcus sp. CC-R104]MEE2032006.1 glutaminase [Rhodococcus sp. CC-R104]